MFKLQIKIDLAFIRSVMIIGNIIISAVFLPSEDLNQLHIVTSENIVFGVLMTAMQLLILKNWEELKLPFKMRDQKANYLFRRLNYPDDRAMIEAYLDGEDLDADYDYSQYLKFFNIEEVFLDNKLEELLNVFGKR